LRTKLNEEEDQFVHKLLTWDQTLRSKESVFYNLLLISGGIVIVVVAFLTVQHLNDRTVLWVTVPGFLTGVLLIGLYIIGMRRIKERRLVASVLKKQCSNN